MALRSIAWLAWFVSVTCVVLLGCDAKGTALGARASATATAHAEAWTRDAHGALVAAGWSDAATRTRDHGLAFGARAPERADEAIDVGLKAAGEDAHAAEFTLHVTHEGLRARGHEEAGDDGVTYRDVAPGADLVIAANAVRVEWSYVLHDEAAPRSFAMHVALPAGLPRAAIEHAGSLAFFDAHGKTRLRVLRPFAIDARGVRREATLAWEASRARLEVTLDTNGLAFPVVLDPAVEHPVWEEAGLATASSPSAREFAATAYDAARGVTILFGGYATTALADTWTWNGTAWSALAPATSPPARQQASITYDSTRQRTVVFGGVGSDGIPRSDTWEWDGTTWASIAATTSPPARANASMAYDAAHGVSVLFGGVAGGYGGYLADTWTWDGTSWIQASPTTSPAARYGASIDYDSVRSRTVLFGGQGGAVDGGSGAFADTWEWDGTSWTRATPTSSPPASLNAAMTYDATRKKSVFLESNVASPSNATWTWDGTTWASLSAASPSSRSGASMTFDTARAKATLFGGISNGTLENDTWEWNGTTWGAVVVTAPVAPAWRIGSSMAYDSVRSKTVMFGGAGFSGELNGQYVAPQLNDTWEWDGASWTERLAAQPWEPYAPYGGFSYGLTPRSGVSMAYDSTRHLTLLFGGFGQADNGSSPIVSGTFNETWAWNGTSWSMLAGTSQETYVPPYAPPNPSARTYAAFAFDSVRGKAVLFGGASSSGTALNDTWEWDGTTWAQKAPATSPSIRANALMVFDVARAVSVLFGGASTNDTWAWDGTNWTQAAPTTSPPARAGATFAYDSARQKSVLYGGSAGANAFSDTWEWDGTNWQSPSIASPPARTGAASAYDAKHGTVVVYGGTNDTDTWLYFTFGAACSTNASCDTGACVDGVCCTQTCGTCQSCDLVGTEGVCTNVAAGANDPDTCAAPNVCTASGACGAIQAAACTTNAQCASGFCADGVCCDSTCASDCEACTVANGAAVDGFCAIAKGGSAGKGACGVYACSGVSATCTNGCTSDVGCANGYYCAANGTCVAQQALGAACHDGAGQDCLDVGCRECAPVGDAASGQCVDNVCCNTACDGACDVCNGVTPGTCTNAARGAAGSPSCGAYLCTGTSAACGTTCATNADCAGAAYCDVTTHECIGTAANGDTCASDGVCASQHCVSGMCCQTTCAAFGGDAGDSSACQIGTCDPSSDFTCKLPGGDKVCRAESCAKGIQTFIASCDGSGNCGALETKTCTPYACGDTQCKDSCTSDADCDTPSATCNVATNTCVTGATCSANGASVVANNGVITACSPYVCEASACAKSCSSIHDCANGFVCDSSGACVASVAATPVASSGGCSCRVAESKTSRGDLGVLAGLGAFVFVGARRRRTKRRDRDRSRSLGSDAA